MSNGSGNSASCRIPATSSSINPSTEIARLYRPVLGCRLLGRRGTLEPCRRCRCRTNDVCATGHFQSPVSGNHVEHQGRLASDIKTVGKPTWKPLQPLKKLRMLYSATLYRSLRYKMS